MLMILVYAGMAVGAFILYFIVICLAVTAGNWVEKKIQSMRGISPRTYTYQSSSESPSPYRDRDSSSQSGVSGRYPASLYEGINCAGYDYHERFANYESRRNAPDYDPEHE